FRLGRRRGASPLPSHRQGHARLVTPFSELLVKKKPRGAPDAPPAASGVKVGFRPRDGRRRAGARDVFPELRANVVPAAYWLYLAQRCQTTVRRAGSTLIAAKAASGVGTSMSSP